MLELTEIIRFNYPDFQKSTEEKTTSHPDMGFCAKHREYKKQQTSKTTSRRPSIV